MKRIITFLTFTMFSFLAFGQSPNVRIYEIYGAGGNASAIYKNDYVVLYNASSTSVNLTGWSLQYASATGNFGTNVNVCPINSGTIQGYSFFLIKLAVGSGCSGAACGADLPTEDANGIFTGASPVFPIALAAGAGKIALLNNQTYINTAVSNPIGAGNIVDFVGYGTTANASEGGGGTATSTVAPTTTLSIRRKGTGAATGQDTDNNLNDFATFTLNTSTPPYNSSTAPVIPIELIYFSATQLGNQTKLNWQTATELNNAYYEIERSSEGKTFEKIGEISGYGNSNVTRTYSFVDEKPNTDVNYYRLRQVDFDGKASVSKIVSVNFGKNTTVKVYPNIAKDQINVELNSENGATDLFVVNQLGQVVKSQKLQNTEGVRTLNISDLPNGFYFINIVSKNGNLTQRFEKQ